MKPTSLFTTYEINEFLLRMYVKLLVDMFDVRTHRIGRNHEFLLYESGITPAGKQIENLSFSSSEAVASSYAFASKRKRFRIPGR